MKLLLVGLVMVALAGCGVPDNLPTCDKDAAPHYLVQAQMFSADTAAALAEKGWTVTFADSGSGLVIADCHLSARWNQAGGGKP